MPAWMGCSLQVGWSSLGHPHHCRSLHWCSRTRPGLPCLAPLHAPGQQIMPPFMRGRAACWGEQPVEHGGSALSNWAAGPAELQRRCSSTLTLPLIHTTRKNACARGPPSPPPVATDQHRHPSSQAHTRFRRSHTPGQDAHTLQVQTLTHTRSRRSHLPGLDAHTPQV